MTKARPTFRQLEAFVAIARASSFRGAALRLGLSQPALTQQIAALEDLLGVQLFDRSRGGTLLAPAGRELLPLARDILEQFQLLDEFTHDNPAGDLAGSFRMGVSPSIGPNLLPRVLPALHARYPNLRLHIREDLPRNLESGLDAGTYDIILTLLPMHAGRNRVRPLFVEPLKLVLHNKHPLLKKTKLRARDLHQQDVLSIDEQHHLHRQIQQLCERFGAHQLRQYEGNSLSSLRLMAMLGLGLALLPALFITAEIVPEDGITVRELDDEKIYRTHIAAWRKNSSARHLFQKLSYEIKAIAMENFEGQLFEAGADEAVPETW
ncbi:MAG: LysR family transcriptional regulator [Pseudomonadales bacterium]|jgi:LysR family hydrogen peroxide-inducible transcriptional activator|nr:LysR family transcriptional regulator [Pseudomonadales bacterium]